MGEPRYFEFQDGTSNKFWEVELQETQMTVRFGRSGTQGQSQVKVFESAEKASKAYEKLIAEKTGKGYQERTAATLSSATMPAPAAAPRKPVAKSVPPPAAAPAASATAGEPAAPASPAPATTAPQMPISLDTPRSIDLTPEDWHWASWRQLPPPTEEPIAEFNLEKCLERLKKAKVVGYFDLLDFSKVGVPRRMSREEAHFWVVAMRPETSNDRIDLAATAAAMRQMTFDGTITASDLRQLMKKDSRRNYPYEWVLAICSLFPVAECMGLIIKAMAGASHFGMSRGSMTILFKTLVVPRLSETERNDCREKLRPMVTPSQWQKVENEATPFHLAAALGMHDELQEVIESWPNDYFNKSWRTGFLLPQEIIFGLRDPVLICHHLQRLGLGLQDPDQARGWLAHTEYQGLKLFSDTICAITDKDGAERIMEVFCLVHAPEAVGPMLDIYLDSKVSRLAREWLDANPAHAITGLVVLAGERGRRGDAAMEFLKSFKNRGHAAAIQAAAAATGDAGLIEKIRSGVLESVDCMLPPFSAADTPEWLRTAPPSAKRVKIPDWLHPEDLPAIAVGQNRLAAEQVSLLLQTLLTTPPGQAAVLFRDLKAHADPASLDAFAWRLFELWLAEAAPSKDKWAFLALGHLGNDRSALKLTPLIRAWPGESQHARAVTGLEILRGIGSETALMQLNGIAQKVPFKGLKQKAIECMEAIAADKGLTRAELEDLCVPDCGLDQRGRRILDFGPRQFDFVLGPDLKPMVRDDKGGLKDNPPAPNAKDDADLAARTVEEWKLLKKQIKEVAKLQAVRLEQAMVTGRRWRPGDFDRLIVRHPLMTHLARLLLWGGFDAAGNLAGTFRVTEEQDYADAADEPISLAGFASIGIVHPLQIAEAEKNAWGEVFSDYAIIPPFVQIGRPVYRLEANEAEQTAITRFKGLNIVAPTLVFGLEKLNWQRGLAQDAGMFDEHSKQFPAANITAVVLYEGCVSMGYIDPDELLELGECYFVAGLRKAAGWDRKSNEALPLVTVDPIVISEVLADLQQLAAKAKP
jgi:predicted DNA-binding WGR domain protein